jgi:hypothetical protein
MARRWKVWASPAACLFLLFPYTANGQQGTDVSQQQTAFPSHLLQSSEREHSSQQSHTPTTQPPARGHSQHLPDNRQHLTPDRGSQPLAPGAQDSSLPNAQQEIPAVWPPSASAAANEPGYLGMSGKDFYRSRFCMHAMTVQGVEVVAVAPQSPAERAGLRPARAPSAREVAAATIAGLLVLSPAAPLAPSVARAAGVDHGDIILAVGGTRVKVERELQQAIARFGPDAVVYLTVRRGETILQLPVQLDHWSPPPSPPLRQEARAAASN